MSCKKILKIFLKTHFQILLLSIFSTLIQRFRINSEFKNDYFMVSPPPKTIGGYYNKNSMNMTCDLNSYNSVDDCRSQVKLQNNEDRGRSKINQLEQTAKSTRSFSQGVKDTYFEFGKTNKQIENSDLQREVNRNRNQESCMSNIMTWGGDSTKNQMKSYSTLTQQIKSFSHDEEADNGLGSRSHPKSDIFTDEIKRQAMSYEQSKKIMQDNTKEKITFPSNQRQVDENNKIIKLEAMLSNLNSEKQRLEQEITKFPTTGGKSLRDIKHRRDVEQNLDFIEKNISQVKLKLRDLKVL